MTRRCTVRVRSASRYPRCGRSASQPQSAIQTKIREQSADAAARSGLQPLAMIGGPRTRTSVKRATLSCRGSAVLRRTPTTPAGSGISNKIGVRDVAAIDAAQQRTHPSWSFCDGEQGWSCAGRHSPAVMARASIPAPRVMWWWKSATTICTPNAKSVSQSSLKRSREPTIGLTYFAERRVRLILCHNRGGTRMTNQQPAP
jgi:hypothetical protein